MAVVIGYTLPALQLICYLVPAGTPGINTTGSFTVPNILPTQPQLRTLPEGYVAYPDIGRAYKVHNKFETWIDARNLCIKEGGQLAFIDSAKKIQYVKDVAPNSYVYIGIIRMYDQTMWIDITTGLPVTSLPWLSGWPVTTEGDCVVIQYNENKLYNAPCRNRANFVCEIPINTTYTIVAN